MQVVGADAIHKEARVLADVLWKSREETSLSAWRLSQTGDPTWPVGFPKPASRRCCLEGLLPSPGWRTLLFCQRFHDEQILWKDFGDWTLATTFLLPCVFPD